MNRTVKFLIIYFAFLSTSGFAQNELNDLSIRQREVTVYNYGECSYIPTLLAKRVKLFVVEKNRKENQIFISTFLPQKMIFKKNKRQTFTIVTPNYYQDDLGFIHEKFQGSMIEIPPITFKKQKKK